MDCESCDCNHWRISDPESYEKHSWTAHHASFARGDSSALLTVNTIMPVIDHVSNHIDFQYHIMCTAAQYTEYLNPGQTTVGCADQPLYALKNKIQWSCPKQSPLSEYFPFWWTPRRKSSFKNAWAVNNRYRIRRNNRNSRLGASKS